MKFKKDVQLFNDKGTPVTSPFEPLFVSQDQDGNFLLVTDLAYLTKVDQYGQKIYRKRLMEYRNHWFNRSRKRNRPYFVKDIQQYGNYEKKENGTGSVGSLFMLSADYSKTRDLIFVGQHSRCDPNDVIVYNGDGKYLYHWMAPVGPSAISSRDSLLYLADHYQALIHVHTYEGQWLRSYDLLFQDRFQGNYYLKNKLVERYWDHAHRYRVEDKYFIASMYTLGGDKLAIGMEGGLVRVLNREGDHLYDIEALQPGLYPNSMVGDSSENLFVYYTANCLFQNPKGLYRYGADGKVRGPLFKGEMGIFSPKEKDLKKRISKDHASAYDYFQLADFQIRRDKLSEATIRLLENSLERKPDLWIAMAYLGLSLMKLRDTERAVKSMEVSIQHLSCGVMATELMAYYLKKEDKEKVLQYFMVIEKFEGVVDVEFYTDKLTTEDLEQFLGKEVKRTNSGCLQCAN
jgi:hypothetical protein